MPICYKGNVESLIGPDEPLLWPSCTAQLDFELELDFFTSGGGQDLIPAEAAGRLAGVIIFNDVSAREPDDRPIQGQELLHRDGPVPC